MVGRAFPQPLAGGQAGSALSPCTPPTLFWGWTAPPVRTFSLQHSRAKPACHLAVEDLCTGTHMGLSSVWQPYLKTALLPTPDSFPPIFPSPGQIPAQLSLKSRDIPVSPDGGRGAAIHDVRLSLPSNNREGLDQETPLNPNTRPRADGSGRGRRLSGASHFPLRLSFWPPKPPRDLS